MNSDLALNTTFRCSSCKMQHREADMGHHGRLNKMMKTCRRCLARQSENRIRKRNALPAALTTLEKLAILKRIETAK